MGPGVAELTVLAILFVFLCVVLWYGSGPNPISRLFAQSLEAASLDLQEKVEACKKIVARGTMKPTCFKKGRPVYKFPYRDASGRLSWIIITKGMKVSVESSHNPRTKSKDRTTWEWMSTLSFLESQQSDSIAAAKLPQTPDKAKFGKRKNKGHQMSTKVNRPKNTPLAKMTPEQRLMHIQQRIDNIIRPECDDILRDRTAKSKKRALAMLKCVDDTFGDLISNQMNLLSDDSLIFKHKLVGILNDCRANLKDFAAGKR